MVFQRYNIYLAYLNDRVKPPVAVKFNDMIELAPFT